MKENVKKNIILTTVLCVYNQYKAWQGTSPPGPVVCEANHFSRQSLRIYLLYYLSFNGGGLRLQFMVFVL